VQKELTLEEFYASDPQRAAIPEVSYGSLWREFALSAFTESSSRRASAFS
jgi:hypothetical protein